jgi:hypothetical protein
MKSLLPVALRFSRQGCLKTAWSVVTVARACSLGPTGFAPRGQWPGRASTLGMVVVRRASSWPPVASKAHEPPLPCCDRIKIPTASGQQKRHAPCTPQRSLHSQGRAVEIAFPGSGSQEQTLFHGMLQRNAKWWFAAGGSCTWTMNGRCSCPVLREPMLQERSTLGEGLARLGISTVRRSQTHV